jgi:exopolysaccharide production protein ExoY
MSSRPVTGDTQGVAAEKLLARETTRPITESGERVGRHHRITDRSLITTVRRANGWHKRALDVVASGLGLFFLLPLLLPIALLIKLTDGGPIFFGHRRVGRYGSTFVCWKFRSMRQDGDAVLQAHLAAHPAAAKEWAETQKLQNDPRVTLIGRFLRVTSLDELPQLINVLLGDMSLVGPRPVTRGELDRYGRDRRYYLVVRPGLTGLWQVSGRNKVSYARRVAFDRHYVQTWSFMGDIAILFRTVWVVITRDGAA